MIPAPDTITAPFTVVIDTREQAPYDFAGLRAGARDGRRPLAVPTVRQGLPSGDYSIAGCEQWLAVERKSAADLFGTVGQGRPRFQRELERLNQLAWAAVVVEASWPALIESPPPHSLLSPKVVHRSVIAWAQRYPRVHWWFMGDRRLAEVTTFRLLERWWKDHQPGAKPGKP